MLYVKNEFESLNVSSLIWIRSKYYTAFLLMMQKKRILFHTPFKIVSRKFFPYFDVFFSLIVVTNCSFYITPSNAKFYFTASWTPASSTSDMPKLGASSPNQRPNIIQLLHTALVAQAYPIQTGSDGSPVLSSHTDLHSVVFHTLP